VEKIGVLEDLSSEKRQEDYMDLLASIQQLTITFLDYL
jgi:hypothetical protein